MKTLVVANGFAHELWVDFFHDGDSVGSIAIPYNVAREAACSNMLQPIWNNQECSDQLDSIYARLIFTRLERESDIMFMLGALVIQYVAGVRCA